MPAAEATHVTVADVLVNDPTVTAVGADGTTANVVTLVTADVLLPAVLIVMISKS